MCNLKFNLHIIGEIKETFRIFRTIILCDNSEIDDLRDLLMMKGIVASIVHEDDSEEGVRYLEGAWSQSKAGDHIGKFLYIVYVRNY